MTNSNSTDIIITEAEKMLCFKNPTVFQTKCERCKKIKNNTPNTLKNCPETSVYTVLVCDQNYETRWCFRILALTWRGRYTRKQTTWPRHSGRRRSYKNS